MTETQQPIIHVVIILIVYSSCFLKDVVELEYNYFRRIAISSCFYIRKLQAAFFLLVCRVYMRLLCAMPINWPSRTKNDNSFNYMYIYNA